MLFYTFLFIIGTTSSVWASFNLEQAVEKYKTQYPLHSLMEKGTDNRGEGDAKLYGTRNFRAVLPGVLYRGGANNKFLAEPRANMNPLPQVGLDKLCHEEFAVSIYLYGENYSTAPRKVNCEVGGKRHQMGYKQHAAYGENYKILSLVFDRIKGKVDGPVYAHCWNGWHSSGMISAMALKQFCGWSDDAADSYWVAHTDGHSKGFPKIRQRIRDFRPYPEFSISKEEQKFICPQYDFSF